MMFATKLFMIVLFGIMLTPTTPRAAPKSEGKIPKELKEKLKNSNGKIPASNEIEMINNATGEMPKLYHIDIMVTDEDRKTLRSLEIPRGSVKQTERGSIKRNADRFREKVWRTRKIPWEIDSQVPSAVASTILQAIAIFNDKTCITWVPKTNGDKNWVRFIRANGCWSWVGKQYHRPGRPQDLSIGEGCEHVHIILHEMMHAAGFYHEQSRPDRDRYIRVNYENIPSSWASQFDKLDFGTGDTLDEPYDYASVMHYGGMLLSKNGQPSMQAINDPSTQLGGALGMTSLDIKKIEKYYDCPPRNEAWSVWTEQSPCFKHRNYEYCIKLSQRFCTKEDLSACPDADEYGVQSKIEKCQCP